MHVISDANVKKKSASAERTHLELGNICVTFRAHFQ
jgi:hypothetical protein